MIIPQFDYLVQQTATGFQLRFANDGVIVALDFDRLTYARYVTDLKDVLTRAVENGGE